MRRFICRSIAKAIPASRTHRQLTHKWFRCRNRTKPKRLRKKPVPETDNTLSAPLTQNKPYSTFQLKYPGPEETIQNQPTITVEFIINPPLQPGDTIQLYLDGKPYGQASTNMQPTLSLLDRGTHSLSAAILDVNHRVVKQANANTIYIHQNRVGFPNAAPAGASACALNSQYAASAACCYYCCKPAWLFSASSGMVVSEQTLSIRCRCSHFAGGAAMPLMLLLRSVMRWQS